jgi:O-antigen ligase
MAVGIFTVAWHGGLWIGPISMDMRLFHVIFVGLFLWNISGSASSLKHWKPQLRPLLPWCLMIGWSLLSVSKALDPNSALQGPAQFSMDVVFFLAVILILRSSDDFRFLVICLAVAVIGQAVVALLQFKFTGITIGVIDYERKFLWWRSRGTFRHANQLGMMLLLLLPIVIRGAISALTSKDNKLLAICGAASLIGGIAILTTYSRGSWIGLSVGLMVMVSLDIMSKQSKIRKYARVFLLASLFVGVFGAIKFGDTVVNRLFFDDREEILDGRQSLEQEGILVLQKNPVLGVGYSNEHFYARKAFVHNLYILIPSEIGIPGLVFFAWFLLEFLRLIFKGYRSKIPFVKNYSHGLIGSLVGFLLASIPGPDFWTTDSVQIYFWAALIVIVSLNRLEQLAILKKKKELMARKASFISQENKIPSVSNRLKFKGAT